jgi:hypothetical protein
MITISAKLKLHIPRNSATEFIDELE